VLPLLHPEWWVDDPERVFRMYVQQVLAVSDHVVVTSAKVRDDLASLGWRIPGEVHVIPLGSSFRQRTPEPAPDGRMSVLYVSTVEPRKGHDVLLSAFDLLRADGHDVDLTLVGREGWQCDDIVARLGNHPDLDGRLRWLRSADDLTVATIARGCSIGAFPSRDEGFGLFLEEGLAYGLKMVVSDIAVMRERAQPNVHFAALTPSDLADALVRAHAQPWAATGSVRTMQDFGTDLARLVRMALHASGGSASVLDDDR
jgi:glycosyltransferase involved in cell wall biosynthesis